MLLLGILCFGEGITGLRYQELSLALSQPQSAYSALTKSLQREWIYLQRVVQIVVYYL